MSEEKFKEIIKKRSEDNLRAFNMLFDAKLYGKCMSTIREELDSYIRLYYYENNQIDRTSMLESFFNDERLKNHNGKVLTDRVLVDFGQNRIGQDAIYDFGCKFIHLSKLHDNLDNIWQDNDFKTSVINVINQHYIANLDMNSSIDEVLTYLPKVMYKIHYHINRMIGIRLD